jgi:GxxExxY protein
MSPVALLHRETSEAIIRSFFHTYNRLGMGFLESVYQRALALELRINGHGVIEEAPVTVYYRGMVVGHFRSDLLVDNTVMLELKAAKRIHSRHYLQLHNALRASTVELGLLLNFGLKPEFKRIILMNHHKPKLETLAEPIRALPR